MFIITAGMEGKLEIDGGEGGMADGKMHDGPDLVEVDSAFDGWHEHYGQTDGCQAIQGAHLLLENVRLTTQNPVGLRRKAIELKVDRGTNIGKFGEKCVVIGDTLPVGIEHDVADIARLGCSHHRDNLWMDRGLAS